MDPARLEQVPLFASLDDYTRRRIAHWADEVDVAAGKWLIQEGRPAYEFFVILEGTAEVTQDGERIAELGPGDFFGEIGLLETRRPTASVTAVTPMKLATLIGPALRAFDEELPQLSEQVRGAMRERLAR